MSVIQIDFGSNDPIINVSGNVFVADGYELIAPETSMVNVYGDWTIDGIFTHSNGTICFNGNSKQDVDNGNSSFYNLIIENTASSHGVVFTKALTVDNLLKNTTYSSIMTFTAGTTSVINDINLNGHSSNTRVVVRSTANSHAKWNILNSPQTKVSYTSVSYNDASMGEEINASDGTNLNGGNNINWLFSAPMYESVLFDGNASLLMKVHSALKESAIFVGSSNIEFYPGAMQKSSILLEGGSEVEFDGDIVLENLIEFEGSSATSFTSRRYDKDPKVKLLYPKETSSTNTPSKFIDYGARYAVIPLEQTFGFVTLRIKAQSYEEFGSNTEHISAIRPIKYIEISNTEDFIEEKTLKILYQEGYDYDLTGMNDDYDNNDINVNSIASSDRDYSLDIVRVTNWRTDTGTDNKKVYVRFITDDQHFPACIIPNPDKENTKGFWDDIIIVQNPPSILKSVRIENATSNNFIPYKTDALWQSSQDNIAGVRGYNVDLKYDGDTRVQEDCSDLSNFNINNPSTVLERLVDNQSVLWTLTSGGFGAGECSFEEVSGQSKLKLSMSNSSNNYLGHEIIFENSISDKNIIDTILELKCKPEILDSGDTELYFAVQNFGPFYNGGSVKSDTPIYTNMEQTHQIINDNVGPWGDYVVFEYKNNNTYSIVRPERNPATGLITGYHRENIDFDTSPIKFSDKDFILELIYQENRMDTQSYKDKDYGWTKTYDVNGKIGENNQTVLWQKFKATKNFINVNRIKIKAFHSSSDSNLYWFVGCIVEADENGLPKIAVGSSGDNFIDNPLDINSDGLLYNLRSCAWADGQNSPSYNSSKHRIASEIIDINEVKEVEICLTNSEFTNSIPDGVLLDTGKDYYIGVSCFKIDPSSSYNVLNPNIVINENTSNIEWMCVDAPVESFLPERLIEARAKIFGGMTFEYKNVNNHNYSSQFKIYNKLSTIDFIYSSFIEDINRNRAEFIVDITDVELEESVRIFKNNNINKIISLNNNFKDRTLHAVIGMRTKLSESSTPASITYDYLNFTNDRFVSNIDLSHNIGYTTVSNINESKNLIASHYEWFEEDWNNSWTKRYGSLNGIDINITNNHKLKFSSTNNIYDNHTRNSEIHYLTPSGGNSLDVKFNINLQGEQDTSEFYIAVLPSRYEASIGDVKSIKEGIPKDFLIFGFRTNGDVFLYRPFKNNVISDLIYKSSSNGAYNWSNDIRITIHNDKIPGVSKVEVCHGDDVLYKNNSLVQILPNSSRGFWIAMGLRHAKPTSHSLKMDVGAFKFKYVDSDDYSEISEIYTESFASVDKEKYALAKIEKIKNSSADGSWAVSGVTNNIQNPSVDDPHRVAVPLNSFILHSIDESDEIDPYRMQMVVDINDTHDHNEFNTKNRMFGPYLTSGKKIVVDDFSQSIRWDLEYNYTYPEWDGHSEVYFGISGFLSTNEPGVTSISHQENPVYSFSEIDNCTNNIYARVVVETSSGIKKVGIEKEQHENSTNYPDWSYISFASDGNVYLSKGGLRSGDSNSSFASQSSLTNNYILPPKGTISVVVTPITLSNCDISIMVNDSVVVKASNVSFNFDTANNTRFICGVKRRMPGSTQESNATLSKFELSNINPKLFDKASDYIRWSKKDGSILNNTLFYARNVDQSQQRASNAIVNVNKVLAQTFIAQSKYIKGVSVECINNTNSEASVYLTECSNGLPLLQPSVDGHINPDDSNIIASGWSMLSRGASIAFFTFANDYNLTPGNEYAVIFDGIPRIKSAPTTEDMPLSNSFVYDYSNNEWNALNVICAFKTFDDVWINRKNDNDGVGQQVKITSVNNANLYSNPSVYSNKVFTDLIAPYNPYASPGSTPIVGVHGEDGLPIYEIIGKQLKLFIRAKDMHNNIGSGIWKYRFVYEGDYGNVVKTPYIIWSEHEDNVATHDFIYDGIFLGNKKVYAEVQDRVGNTAITNTINVNLLHGFIIDTEPPLINRVNIEGDASIYPYVDKKEYINKDNILVGLHSIDSSTGCKDYRVNFNYEEDENGMVFSDYFAYLPSFPYNIEGNDGKYVLNIQTRDYGNNAIQPHMEQIEQIKIDKDKNSYILPTAIGVGNKNRLYIGVTKRIERNNLTGKNENIVGYLSNIIYSLWDDNYKQLFNNAAEITVKVNNEIKTIGDDYTIDYMNNLIMFETQLDDSDDVTVDIVEEVAELYENDGNYNTLIKVFDNELERAITCLQEYNGLLYIGTNSGRIYTYNGIKISLSIYRTTAEDGITPIPVSCMSVCKFDVDDRDFLYVGTYSSAQIFKYGGVSGSVELGWNRVDSIASSEDMAVYDIKMYSDVMFIATGPNGKIYQYYKTYNTDGSIEEVIKEKTIHKDKFAEDDGFKLNVLCLENWNNQIFAGTDYNSSIFSYKYEKELMPNADDWSVLNKFNNDFILSPLPWEFYNRGISESDYSDRVSIVETNDDYYMILSGGYGEQNVWVDRDFSASSYWKNISNDNGWTIDFIVRIDSTMNDRHQDVFLSDGTYEIELRIYSNAIEIISGNKSKKILINNNKWRKYRLSVVNNNANVYVDDSNIPLIYSNDILSKNNFNKFIMFGKTEWGEQGCVARWKEINIYDKGALMPTIFAKRDFVREQVLPFGTEVRYLKSHKDGIIAGVQSRNPVDIEYYDDPDLFNPRAYIRSNKNTSKWTLDSIYPSNTSSIISATTWDGKIYSITEITDDIMTNNPISIVDFFTEDPYSPMVKNGLINMRQMVYAYDMISKDTTPPDASVVINENANFNPIRVYMLEGVVGGYIYKEGIAISYTSLNNKVDVANNVIDGNLNTYDTIGTNRVRYIEHSYTDEGTVALSKISWMVYSEESKTYAIEYQNSDKKWERLIEAASDKYSYGQISTYTLSSPIDVMGIRIYYTGDYETAHNDVELTISSTDRMSGTDAMRYSAFKDLRDAGDRPDADGDGWVEINNGQQVLPWDLMENTDIWKIQHTFNSPITKSIEHNGVMILGAEDGSIYYSHDGNDFIKSTFTTNSEVSCFATWRNIVYMGCVNGVVYNSENGAEWHVVVDTEEDSIVSMVDFNDVLYIGTGNNGKLLSWDGASINNVKTFSSARIDELIVDDKKLSSMYVILGPSGQVFKYNKNKFAQMFKLKATKTNKAIKHDGSIYISCNNGRVYSINEDEDVDLVVNTAIRSINDIVSYSNYGPSIINIVEHGSGFLQRGEWRYIVTYINNAGEESGPGEIKTIINNTENGSVKIEWQQIEHTRGYRVYRNKHSGDEKGKERLINPNVENNNYEITNNYFIDNGSYQILDGSSQELPNISPPAEATLQQLWIIGDDGIGYVHQGKSLIQVEYPLEVQGGNGGMQFNGQMYLFGQETAYTNDEIQSGILPPVDGKIAKFVGASIGSGTKSVYAQFKDKIGNISNVIEDTIFYNTMMSNCILQINEDGDIVDYYESKDGIKNKIYSAVKNTEQVGVYESEPFLAQNLSKWNDIELLGKMPYKTKIKLYIRTATTRTSLLKSEWSEVVEFASSVGEGETPSVESLTENISYLNDSWLQFKIVLATEKRGSSPSVYSIKIEYTSTRAAYFFTSIFDLNDMSQKEDVKIKRGVLTWHGAVPDNGDIVFGISTMDEDNVDWGNYQEVLPNRVFEVEPGEKFKVGIMLISTDETPAIVESFAMMFEADEDVKVHADDY